MKASLSRQAYERLERVPARRPSGQAWGQWAIAFLSRLFQSESPSANPEIRLRRSRDAEGKTVWSGYDPAGNRRIGNVSEERLRMWIEQRYRQG